MLYGAANQIAGGVPVTFNGGTFNLVELTQTVLRVLTLSADSSLDFGTRGAQTLHFSSLGSHTTGKILSISSNWVGAPSGSGTDRIDFDSPGSVPSAFLSDVWFSRYGQAAQILAGGEVVPLPCPAVRPSVDFSPDLTNARGTFE